MSSRLMWAVAGVAVLAVVGWAAWKWWQDKQAANAAGAGAGASEPTTLTLIPQGVSHAPITQSPQQGIAQASSEYAS